MEDADVLRPRWPKARTDALDPKRAGRFLMKVQLIVVQGKPEGKIIPLVGPIFKIGRADTCHLRPNSEQVSREHTEFSIKGHQVTVRDLGSRNGTIVNNQVLSGPCILKNSDLIQVGPLTFAISIEGVPVPAVKVPPKKAPAKVPSPDDVSHSDIESWLVSDESSSPPDRPSGGYSGDTEIIATYQGNSSAKPDSPAPPKPAAPKKEAAEVVYDRLNDDEDEDREGGSKPDDAPEEQMDESNPFFKKKPQAAPKASSKDSSDAASDILRKMMERRKGPK